MSSMDAIIEFAKDQWLATALLGVLVMIAVTSLGGFSSLFKGGSKKKKKNRKRKSKASVAAAEDEKPMTASAASPVRQLPKTQSNGVAAPPPAAVATPSPGEVEEEESVDNDVTASPSAAKKKKKKKKKKAAGTGMESSDDESPPGLREESAATPTVATQQQPVNGKKATATPTAAAGTASAEPSEDEDNVDPAAAATETGKKKKKKKKKKSKSAQDDAEQQQKQQEAPAKPEDDDSDDEDLAIFAVGSRDKNKKKRGGGGADEDGAVNNGGWNLMGAKGKTAKGKNQPSITLVTAEDVPKDTFQVDITKDEIPTVIGPKGATIQQIQQSSGCSVDIDKGFNVVRIKGPDEATAREGLRQVRELLDSKRAQVAHTATLKAAEIKGSDGVKAVIGRGGATIKEIQETTSCKLDASVEKGTVHISGPSAAAVEDAVRKCKEAVFGALNQKVELGCKSMVFLICGNKFEKLQALQQRTGVRLDVSGTTLTVSGDVDKVPEAISIVTTERDRCRGTSVHVAANKQGAVIGKGGANIRQIQDKTGAFVEVSAGTEDVKIVGEPDAVKAAEALVRKAMTGEVLELKPGEIRDTIELGVGISAVIGTGGSNIRALEQEHSVKLNVIESTATIVGKKDAVANAKAAIEAIVKPLIEKAEKEAEIEREAVKLAASGDPTWAGGEDDADGW